MLLVPAPSRDRSGADLSALKNSLKRKNILAGAGATWRGSRVKMIQVMPHSGRAIKLYQILQPSQSAIVMFLRGFFVLREPEPSSPLHNVPTVNKPFCFCPIALRGVLCPERHIQNNTTPTGWFPRAKVGRVHKMVRPRMVRLLLARVSDCQCATGTRYIGKYTSLGNTPCTSKSYTSNMASHSGPLSVE